MIDKVALCGTGGFCTSILLGVLWGIAIWPINIFWLIMTMLVFAIGLALLIAATNLAYHNGFKHNQPYATIVAMILKEYINLLNIHGEYSKEEKEFRDRFQKNPELLNLLDTAKMTKTVYSTALQDP
ncbi:MAG: hypothetical protein HZB99_00365 [Candidatus Harrisonbacteria bacterium]|nr:hypothetical protein [Candidatus Harrisonbacteria bacterium]